MMDATVIKSHLSGYPDPVCFEAGEVIQAGISDPDYPGWLWCRTPCGKEGWVHHSFLVRSAGISVSIRPYSARELTAVPGDRGTVMEQLDGWTCLRLLDGREGWIPSSHLSLPCDGGGP